MSTTIPATVTGVNIAALASMVLTVVASTPPETNAKRSIVTALTSGTAVGVRFHTVSDPFDVTVWAPKSPKSLPSPNQNGVYPPIPMNKYSIVVRKGLRSASGLASITSQLTIGFEVPAGAESYDSANVAAMLSAAAGWLNVLADDCYDNALTGSV
jgi:hypothetical protein